MFRFGLQILGQQAHRMPNLLQQGLKNASGFSGYAYNNRKNRKDFEETERDDPPRSRKSDFYQKKKDYLDDDNRPLFDGEDGRPKKFSKFKKSFDTFQSESGSPRQKDKYARAATTPNLLTWEEKERMRQLNQENPQQWSPERLAGSFPASVSTIKSILVSSWEPRDVARHDAAVARHWQQLVDGELDLEPSMKMHLMSFVPGRTEKLDASPSNAEAKPLIEPELLEDSEPPASRVMIQQVQTNFKLAEVSMPSQSTDKAVTKYAAKKVEVEQERPLYAERITIPKEKWKDGATYKVGDVYYHSDGTFLYRVPGMS